ncbi:hypothetical protein L873DRAFT_302643 [Choiromyces venosus 120613-1]|uniref:Uncharacterized protein n=1 Tax=Choiromyces venosus 120613-1 TaxID=1336337 RepID=A0A3N4IZU6_9PEZI|nr:hypothetical protein L873DRAFT_302643 [Choiromyces venosus 120613-1]
MTWNICKLRSLVQPSEFHKHSVPALIPNTNTIIPSTNILIPNTNIPILNTNIPIPNTNHHSEYQPSFQQRISDISDNIAVEIRIFFITHKGFVQDFFLYYARFY